MRIGGRRTGFFLALAVAALGVGVVLFAGASQDPDPPELESGLGTIEPSKSSPSADAKDIVTPAKDIPLGPSNPVSISIPAIDVKSTVFAIGKAADGSLAVPQPGPQLDLAAWFENSPTPGQPGPSIIEGHVATAESGPSVFFDLAKLKPGDEIRVLREDGKTVVFEIDALRNFDKDEFPTELVYGGDLSVPSLRLITCSDFDQSTGSHEGNLVVFSHLVDVNS